MIFATSLFLSNSFLFRVELGLASVFANLNWLIPGRLTLLIRPLMNTIRCVKPIINKPGSNSINNGSEASDSNSSLVWDRLEEEFLPIGHSFQLQCLSSVCLGRLLWLEWCLQLDKAFNLHDLVNLPCNSSKAVVKVVQNLVNSLVESSSTFGKFSVD